MADNDFLDATHPIYDAHKDEWKRQEELHHGGIKVLDELVRFDWEQGKKGEERYKDRQAQAVYHNFPELLTNTMVGHLMANAPKVDSGLRFGTLGTVERDEGQRDPSFAEMVYYNVDGAGNDGSEWPTWWMSATKRAMATGHRWVICDLPAARGGIITLADVLEGHRPILVELSPLAVSNWDYRRGVLQFAVIRTQERRPRIEEGKLVGNDLEKGFILLTARGFEDFGPTYVGGGWWAFNEAKEPRKIKGLGTEEEVETGDWEHLNGEIPMWPHFYERDPGTADKPAISRAATVHLGQAAVAHMNIDSASVFDAWEAAMSMLFFMGVEEENFNEAVDQANAGHRWIGVKVTQPERNLGQLEPPVPVTPTIQDTSTGAVPAEVFEKLLGRLVENAEKLAMQEATSTPDSTGRSKEAGFSDKKAPRLALMASEMQQSQNTAIHFLEMSFGAEKPEGVVRWPREFNLLSLVDHIAEMFDLIGKTGIRSSLLDSLALTAGAQERGIITDDDTAAQVRDEFQAAARMKQLEEMDRSVRWTPGPAKVAVVMEVFEALGMFVTEEGVERTLADLLEGGDTTGLGEAGGKTLRQLIFEAAQKLAEDESRKSEQESSFFPTSDNGRLAPLLAEERDQDGGPPGQLTNVGSAAE